MRPIWFPLLLVAGPVAADPLPDQVDPEPPAAAGCSSCEVSAPKVLTIRGTLFVKSSGDLAVGATVAIEDRDHNKVMSVAITDETGEYKLEVPPGRYDVTAYYLDSTTLLASARLFVDDAQLESAVLDDTLDRFYGCVYILPPEVKAMPHFGATISRRPLPISRDRTHRAWIAPVAMADPVRAATTVEGGRRFTTAPGIPTAFLEDVTTYSLDVPIGLAQGGGGATDVTLRSGSNQRQGEARLILGVDDPRDGSAAAETFLGGPIEKDNVWAAAGLVLRRDAGELAGDGMLRLDGQTHDQQFLLGGLAHDGTDDAGWSTARWKGKFREGKLEVGAGVTGELLRRPLEVAARELGTSSDIARSVDRTGGAAFATLRFKAAGYHTAYASAGAGMGQRDERRHTDASYAIGDDWMWTPSLTFVAGVRIEERTFEGDRARVVVPRAAVKWDPTNEGRSEVFVAAQRVPLVDDGLPGDWTSLDRRSVDELIAGAAYRRSKDDTIVGIAVRQRDDRTGGEVWLRRDTSRSIVHLQATSLDRVATLLAQRRLRDRRGSVITVGTAARVTEDRAEAGVALGWKHSPGQTVLSTELAAEGYAGTDGPGARIVAGILW